MSTYLRKCIDIAPTAVVTPEPWVANDYLKLRHAPWWSGLRATTSWLRLWADWPSVHRVPGAPPGSDADGARSLAALDAQIDAAHGDGMQIILLPYRYPRWANLTTHIAGGGEEDYAFFTWDRFPRLQQYKDWRAGLIQRPNFKALEYRMPPEGHGPDSEWGRYVAWLWERYADQVAAFEVVNEPNGQLWPQRSQVNTDDFDARWGTDGTSLETAPAVAEMMATVDAIARRHPDGPLLLAPSTSDSDVATALRYTTISHTHPYATFFDPFVERLLTALDQRGFRADERWVWSFHNYSDVERKQLHVGHLRRLLSERGWAGRQLDGGPELWSTEGGCRLVGANARFRDLLGRELTVDERKTYQAPVITEALSRHHYAKGAGAGVGMVTQYTTFADRNFDCGLLDEAALGGAPRPALAAWCAVPEFHAAPVQRAPWRPQF